MTISNKKAAKNQLDQINQLLRQSKSHWGYDEKFLDQYIKIMGINEAYLEKNTANSIYLHDELIGFYSFTSQEDGSLELDKFFLHPSYIGQGYGRHLWQACCETAKALGKNEFTIWADFNAEAFYIKLGCIRIGSRESPIRPGVCPPVLKYKIL